MYGIAIEGVLSPSGTFWQRKSEERSCTRCSYWSGSASMKLDAAGNVCVGFEYERDSFVHGYSGQARASGTSCAQ